MRSADHGPQFWKIRGWRGYLGYFVNIFIILIGVFFLSVGTYVSGIHRFEAMAELTLQQASVDSIVMGYQSANFGGPFSCKSNGLAPAVQAPTTAGGASKRWLFTELLNGKKF